MRSILRAIFAAVLLMGSLGGDWAPATPAHHACCCGTPATHEDTCPCPKPENNRTPRGTCAERSSAVAAVAGARRAAQAQRRTEPRPEPAAWAGTPDLRAREGLASRTDGRDPDLGRHLAHLSTFRI